MWAIGKWNTHRSFSHRHCAMYQISQIFIISLIFLRFHSTSRYWICIIIMIIESDKLVKRVRVREVKLNESNENNTTYTKYVCINYIIWISGYSINIGSVDLCMYMWNVFGKCKMSPQNGEKPNCKHKQKLVFWHETALCITTRVSDPLPSEGK